MRGIWGRESLEKGYLSPNQTDTLNPPYYVSFLQAVPRGKHQERQEQPYFWDFSVEIKGKSVFGFKRIMEFCMHNPKFGVIHHRLSLRKGISD